MLFRSGREAGDRGRQRREQPVEGLRVGEPFELGAGRSALGFGQRDLSQRLTCDGEPRGATHGLRSAQRAQHLRVEGAGLGIQFLKHLARTRLLLHLVDIGNCADGAEAVRQIKIIERELAHYGAGLEKRERWLVLNKIDLLAEASEQRLLKAVRKEIKRRPLYLISAVSGRGCRELVLKVQHWLERHKDNRTTAGKNQAHG